MIFYFLFVKFAKKITMNLFQDTEIAFAGKSNGELKKAYRLFKTISSKYLTKLGQILAKSAMFVHFPIRWAVKPTIYSHFVGGETIEECATTVRNLEKYNVKAILDYSVEGKKSEEDIEKALSETLNSIRNAGNDKNIPFAVFKPTAFAADEILEKASSGSELSVTEKKEAGKFRQRIKTLCQAAFDSGVPILIDAEDSFIQKFIDETVEEMMQIFNNDKAVVYNTWQMYRTDRLEFLKTSYEKAKTGNYFLGAKFVRGAYMEKERERAAKLNYQSPIFENKNETDSAFNEALRFSTEHIDRISIFNGTHNEDSSLLLCQLMQERNIALDDSRIWFSQLYGMSDHISFNLAKAGYNVAKYVPYGPVKQVLPYLFRRAEENTSAGKQAGRELTLLTQEIKRRRNQKKSFRPIL
jgi:proline dehydrogenase